MIISTIVGMANNRAIGKENDIPWHLPADLKYFKKTTIGKPIIMGRKCYESIGRPLPKRTNIIITRNKDYEAKGCIITHSLQEAIAKAKEEETTEIFIIGGGEIYQKALAIVDKIYLTCIDLVVEDATVFFPNIDSNQWQLIKEEKHQKDKKNPYDYTFKVLKRV